MTSRRFPSTLYASGSEPDPRFSLANERTFLAWIRTSVALLAVAGALLAIDLPLHHALQWGSALLFACGSVTCAGWGWYAWLSTERQLRHRQPLPGLSWGAGLSALLAVGGLMIVVGALAQGSR